MNKNFVALLLFSIIYVSIFPQILADTDKLVLTVNSQSEYKSGQYPYVSGLVTDSRGNPISDVQIQISFPSRTILDITDKSGKFTITSPIADESGQYDVLVSATKGELFVDAKISYSINEGKSVKSTLIIPQTIRSNESEQLVGENISRIAPYSFPLIQSDMSNSFVNQTLSNTLHLKSSTNVIPTEKLLEKTADSNSPILNQQRQYVNEDLSNDLKSLEKEHESNTPRNVFLEFLNDIDSTVKNIFWGQFLFTEKLVDKGHEAQKKSLDEGKSSKEAMESFQAAAASTRSQIIEHNNNLNIEFGNATAIIQEQFDKDGKLPR